MAKRPKVEKELDDILIFLRKKMKEQGYSQVKVQAELGWKGSYISQLFNRTKALRVEQILLILDVIGIEPLEFYSEFYRVHGAPIPVLPTEQLEPGCFELLAPRYEANSLVQESTDVLDRFFYRFAEVRTLLRSIIHLLAEKDVITLSELQQAAEAAERGMPIFPHMDNTPPEEAYETEEDLEELELYDEFGAFDDLDTFDG